MRRLLSMMLLTGCVAATTPDRDAAAQDLTVPMPLEPLQRIGRHLGVGWGDGYHACERELRLPTADLAPRSYAAQHALHPHHGQNGRQHWQAAVQASQPPAYFRPPQPVASYTSQPNAPTFKVPQSILEELDRLPSDSIRKPPAAGSPSNDARQAPVPSADSPSFQPEAIPTPPPTRRPATAPPNVRRNADVANELDSILDGLVAPEVADENVEPSSPSDRATWPPRDNAPSVPSVPSRSSLPIDADSILDGPLDSSDSESDLLNDPLGPANDPLLDDAADDDLLLGYRAAASAVIREPNRQQTGTHRFVREPEMGEPQRLPASMRVARQRTNSDR